MKKKKALITGITGQDGSYLAEFLLKKGYEVHGIKRRSSSFNTQRIDHLYEDPHDSQRKLYLHYGDLTDSSNLIKIIGEIKPHEIYNLGAQSHVAVSFESPEYTANCDALGILRILEAIRLLNLIEHTKVYQASTSELYGLVQEVPQKETTPFYPKSPYGVAKASSFWQVANYRESYDLFACSGIMFNHESNLRPKRFVTRKICKAAARIALGSDEILNLGDISIKRDWGWAPEYVKAMWMMLQQKNADDFVIATGHSSTLREFISAAFSALDLNWENHVISNPKLYRPSEIRSIYGSPNKANEILNWRAEKIMPEIAKIMSLNEFKFLKNK